jgi:hypothetical protein
MIAYIDSPLQLICAIEYQQKNHGINFFYIRRSSNETDKQINYIIDKYSFLQLKFIYIPPLVFCNIFLWFRFIVFNFYKKILFGNNDSLIGRFFINKTLSDDGTKTISILSRRSFKKYWTFFDVNDMKVHSFEFIKSFFNVNKLDETNLVYFIGQKLVEAQLLENAKYLELLKKVKIQFNNSKIYYFKHRGESDNNLAEIKKMGFIVKSLDYPIEFHPIEEKIKPSHVIGFFSTALITLNEIYNINFSYLVVRKLLEEKHFGNNYVEIYKYLENKGKNIS